MQSEARQNKCQNARQQNDARDASDLGLAAMQGNSEVLTKGRVVFCEEDARGDCMGEFGWEICMGEEEGRESLFTMGGPGGQRASDCVGATVCVLKVVNVGSVESRVELAFGPGSTFGPPAHPPEQTPSTRPQLPASPLLNLPACPEGPWTASVAGELHTLRVKYSSTAFYDF
ncbi:hypothetical protein X797_004148 [Metarhizium robertsii]|uniref:Uncharacterized protein n=1 Tax=Metarhizium robertsii TaxID=568076 RepID=A0A0A1UZN4_9HYPO|nr:hypothetical protein X797_004148 [Metarhizium robertsii]